MVTGGHRVGLLWPADGRNDREFWRWLPDNVALLIARYDVGGTLDPEQLEADAELDGILGAARLLRHADPHIIALGDCAGSFIGGRTGNETQSRAVADAAGVPAITMSTAFVAALTHLRLGRVSVLSPYGPDVTQRFLRFLAEHDIGCVSARSIRRGSEKEIDAMTADEWIEEARRVTADEAEALIVAGGGVSLCNGAEALETTLAMPVITGPGALMWAALEHIGAEFCRTGLGVLYRTKS